MLTWFDCDVIKYNSEIPDTKQTDEAIRVKLKQSIIACPSFAASMHDIQTIAINHPGRLSICQSRPFTQLRCANTAEWINILLEVWTLGNPLNP